MRRAALFVVVFGAGLVLLLLIIVWYLLSYQAGQASMSSMMGQMMGNQNAGGLTSPMPSYVWAGIVALLVVVAGGIVGFGYYVSFPEIRRTAAPTESTMEPPDAGSGQKEDWAVLVRTSKPEEKRVLEIIAAHEGRYLQKFIAKESGLSKVKTHRIVARFAERGIVSVSKSGNTNEVALAPWLKPGSGQKGPSA